jgi:phosphoribosyl-dephospho-CoA transferase
MLAKEALICFAACWERRHVIRAPPRSKCAGGLPSSGMASPLLLRGPELRTHTLVRICGPQALRTDSNLPTWARESISRAPWVVIRRAQIKGELVPVGVRGESRQQRFAALLSSGDALELVTPQALASRRSWAIAAAADPARYGAIPALAVLTRVERIMCEHGLEGLWGPGGSVGFELASARATVTSSSDLDLVVDVDRPELIAKNTRSLWAALAALPVRLDVLLETSQGALVLSEYVRARGSARQSFVLRTPTGPRLTHSIAGL